uniref:Integrase core domain-containing protein n=1 Tax=Oryzias latipes TaxID=8090 RepID=A0A3P9JDE3_ORYLA
MFCPFCGVHFGAFVPFCASCGRSLELLRGMEQAGGSDVLQHKYFNEGHSYSVILDMLLSLHGVRMSLRTLKSKLNQSGLYRRKYYSSRTTVINAIRAELRGPGQLFGYRTMWQVLKQKHQLQVKRDTVMELLRELNPRGCQSRARRRFIRRTYHSLGPNYMWHADGYDKLKPFGLAISGCIDGFSRKVLWLKCGATNNNPTVIAHNFLSCIRNLNVVPMRLRTDCGTENGIMAAVQCTLRHQHNDHYSGESSHMFGSSTSNQRIESWWSIYRKGRAQFWMELFADLRDAGHVNGSQEHQRLLRYSFGDVVQKDLDECVKLWNTHQIRPSRTASCPGGVPNELYYLPHRHGSRDCGFIIQHDELDAFPESSLSLPSCGDPNTQEYLHFVMDHNRFQKPENWESASELYMKLKEIAQL